MSRLQHFGWFLSRGFGPQGWGTPAYEWNLPWTRPELYQQSIRTLEAAGFDLVIIEDALSLGNPDTLDLRIREAYGGPKHDPFLLAPYLFAATEHIGVVPTVNPLAYAPYQAARQFATLQHLSGGRFGMNVVTDVGSSRHFGVPPVPHDVAYERAAEWLGGIQELWRSWDDGALIQNPVTREFADGSKLRTVHHRGKHFRFDGPLNALPFAHDEPIVVSPGGSPRGIDFAGRHSQVQLALAPLQPEKLRDYRRSVRVAAQHAGRSADEILTLFVFKPTIVSSAEEADRLVAAAASPSDETLLRIAVGQSSDLETNLLAHDLDRPLSPSIFGEHVSQGSIKGLLGRYERFEDATLRELLTAKARLGRISTREGTVGTAEEIADFIDELGSEAENDGLIFSGDFHPVTVHTMLNELVPILRRKGILRTEYSGGTLRENLASF
ncbi:LLM class flavin-dependent oxidoreductase [Humidisolicoccus flavus]|uniref:LLM class flavin-dependent oxidoreductase n=1 Tax=Humidisolicoccus flavus TaxID=3111414 RepID=UPI0032457C98